MSASFARRWLTPLLMLSATVAAVEGVQLGLERLSTPWGTLEGVTLSLDPIHADGGGLGLKITHLPLPAPLGSAKLSLECPALRLEPSRIHCPEGELQLTEPSLGLHQLHGDVTFLPDEDALTVTLKGERFAGGALDLRLEHQARRWQVKGSVRGGDIGELKRIVALWVPKAKGWKGRGRTTLHFNLKGSADALAETHIDARLTEAVLESPDGRVATSGLTGRLHATGSGQKGLERLSGKLSLSKGELYADPIYWKSEHGALISNFDLIHGADHVEIKRLTWHDPEVLNGRGSARLSKKRGEWGLGSAELTLERVDATPAYQRYIQPLVADHHLLGQLELAGRLAGELRWDGETVAWAELRIDQLFVDDPVGRFGLYGLDGTIGWSSGPVPRESDLRWVGGHFFALDLGLSALRARAEEGRLTLLNELRQPILDGTLLVDTLDLELTDQGAVNWQLDAVLTPISMTRLSETLGWPTMSGRVSGVIPRLRYHGGVMTLGGDLLARLFDGEVLIRDLTLDHPFDPICATHAEVELRRLDLESLTRTFAFGSIQGRLEGEIKALRLEQWKPVAFDAWFATPEGDDSRHRISQRAVENISELGGGGMGGALSRGFLGLFDEFGYDRIGIGCTLRDGVCQMEGVAPVDGGYYLVKGGGLPRIDVIGYAHRVDWEELIARLRNVTLSDPEIR